MPPTGGAWIRGTARSHLERAFAERDGVLIATTTWPGFRWQRDDPRYNAMPARLGLQDPRRRRG